MLHSGKPITYAAHAFTFVMTGGLSTVPTPLLPIIYLYSIIYLPNNDHDHLHNSFITSAEKSYYKSSIVLTSNDNSKCDTKCDDAENVDSKFILALL